ncbi:3-hydroxybutyryl-CoA dehydrogenase [Rhodobacteraceae bacterium THAF1]|uniref:3-hydroxyacyl-CoA dehydrogenase family protein n=1 Tax=Palleronia sp. THAF1 TaxID=2587842 RepID=UPI000F3BB938|nr:3-hydroxyacyl-CoA dehydrogenase family protein [Palleronia sp. THAF1]QFU08780.1 3-hydroxybutyryl-CoA dehydrogenase [Palleronia sp. THAF1]VDC31201.1 3-hydroxybutyryl-CoA dehydrogenase [Rhodobacteraceae bacterium THAF1]
MTPEAQRIAVVGGGTMGAGIAYVFAMAGFETTLVEPDAGRAEEARATMQGAATAAIQRSKVEAEVANAWLSAITILPAAADLPETLDLVIETVPEQRALKDRVLAEIATRRPRLIATNTSALSVDDLSGAVGDPAAFLGMHFFNPVWSLKLVEIVRGAATSDAALAQAEAFTAAIGKVSAVVADAPGFATSRLDLILAIEAMRMVEDGVASPADIDRAVTTAYRHPMGPLRLSDVVGLDVRLDIATHLDKALGPRFAPPQLLKDMVSRGDLGRKSGRGFYDWAAEAADKA